MIEVADRIALHRLDQVGEHLERLALILRQRIALAHRPQADARPEIVHLGEVLPPLVVDDREHDRPLDLGKDIGAELLLAFLISFPSLVDGKVDDIVYVVGALELGDVDLGRVELLELSLQRLPVPVALRGLGREDELDRGGYRIGDPVLDEVFAGRALENRAAPVVYDLTLAVHHLVVFENVLADLEVLRLDLSLRPFDRLRDHLCLDRLIFGKTELLHHPGHPFTLEPAHEVVFQGEVEAALARVSLAARPTAQLVVDSPRVVSLRTDHVEPACLDDRLFRRLDLGGELLGELLLELFV